MLFWYNMISRWWILAWCCTIKIFCVTGDISSKIDVDSIVIPVKSGIDDAGDPTFDRFQFQVSETGLETKVDEFCSKFSIEVIESVDSSFYIHSTLADTVL